MSGLDNLSYYDPTSALHLSQKAPEFFKRPLPSGKPFPLSLLESSESPEAWADYEKLLIACLRTGDDESAFLCLERLTQRFGAEDDRILALKGLCQEATAKNTADLEKILQEYESILEVKPMSVVRLFKQDKGLLTEAAHFETQDRNQAGHVEVFRRYCCVGGIH